jgi:hypothetical protein
MSDLVKIRAFPPVAKLFVALFTTLMLAVCLWAVWIYTVDKGEVDQNNLPAYMSTDAGDDLTPDEEIEAIAADSDAALAPIWDAEHAGEEERLDSVDIDSMEELVEVEESGDADMADVTDDTPAEEVVPEDFSASESLLRHNLGLAHVHVNGQTLLFFALGALFLFTSVTARIKKTVLWTFGITILVHAVGLSGAGFYAIFDDMVALSGVVMLALIAYMCLMIYVDLGRKAK